MKRRPTNELVSTLKFVREPWRGGDRQFYQLVWHIFAADKRGLEIDMFSTSLNAPMPELMAQMTASLRRAADKMDSLVDNALKQELICIAIHKNLDAKQRRKKAQCDRRSAEAPLREP